MSSAPTTTASASASASGVPGSALKTTSWRSLPRTVRTSQSAVNSPTTEWISVLRWCPRWRGGVVSHSSANRAARLPQVVDERRQPDVLRVAQHRVVEVADDVVLDRRRRRRVERCRDRSASPVNVRHATLRPRPASVARRPEQRVGRRVLDDHVPRRVDHRDRQVGEPLDHPQHARRDVPVDLARGGRQVPGEPVELVAVDGVEPEGRVPARRPPGPTGSSSVPARAAPGSPPRHPPAAPPPRGAGRPCGGVRCARCPPTRAPPGRARHAGHHRGLRSCVVQRRWRRALFRIG